MSTDNKIQVKLMDQASNLKNARLPRNLSAGQLAAEIAKKLGYPSDQEYVLFDKQQGKRLDPSHTLDEQGVSEGAVLQILGEQRAG